jgi:hypothetical protein
MPQRKLICPNPATATSLAAKLARHRPGREFQVYGVSFGYQVVEVRRFAGYGYSWDGTRWVKQPRQAWSTTTYAVPEPPRPPLVTTVSLPFAQETKAYIGAMVNGALAWFGKGTLCAYAVADGMVSLTLPIKIASKRGLV